MASHPPAAVRQRADAREFWKRVRVYTMAVAAVAMATATTFGIRGWMSTSYSLFFFPAVVAVAMYGGYGPALVATVCSVASLAFFFVPPYYSFSIGTDDLIRLLVFAGVATVTSSISSARARAEAAQRRTLTELQGAVNTLRKVSGWPVFVDASLGGGARRLLDHAASVMECAASVCVWEAEDEPWVYLAASAGTEGVKRYPPNQLEAIVPEDLTDVAFVSEAGLGEHVTVDLGDRGTPPEPRQLSLPADVAAHFRGSGVASAPFEVEHLRGRLFFTGLTPKTPAELIPLAEVVAREVGNSLERLHLHDRLQQLAIREDRIRVARDLHDGVLQSLTGIRFQLQALADELEAPAAMRDSLLGVERAIAIEQRELRLFIEDLKPDAVRPRVDVNILQGLEEMRARLADEWKTPIVVRVTPPDHPFPSAEDQTVRLLVREAVVNALKHAHPSRVSVDIDSPNPETLRIVVGNDGRGFPFKGRLEHHELVAQNVGPVSLRERLTSLGGSLAIESTPAGARLELLLPVTGGSR